MRMSFYILVLFLSVDAESRTVDCGPDPCSEVHYTDIIGARKFGITINKIATHNPSITSIDIFYEPTDSCKLGAIDVSLGESSEGKEPNAIVSVKNIKAIDGLIIRNNLVESTHLVIDVNCKGKLGEKWSKNVNQILDVSLQ